MIATVYAMLARLAENLNAQRHLLVPARRITLIFILSDVFTFLIQVSPYLDVESVLS